MSYVNHNGKIVEQHSGGLPYDNRAFRYGYCLFETMLVQHGAIRLKDYHWQRLFDSMATLRFDIPKLLTKGVLEQELLKTVEKNNLSKLCRVRLQIYAGSGGLYERDNAGAGYLIECFSLEPYIVQINEQGLTVGVAEGLMKSADRLANHKTGNALIYAMAAQQAQENKWNDAIVLNTAGNIIESTIANIWWVEGEVFFTVPLSEGCVGGVMRRHLLELLPQKGYNVGEKVLNAERLAAADEVFLTNAIRGIRWVKTVVGLDKSYNDNLAQKISEIIF